MKSRPTPNRLLRGLVALVCLVIGATPLTRAATTTFFTSLQTTNLVASGVTTDTIRSEGYVFSFTRDKLFTGGVGLTNPIGRYLRVHWPDGLEAQSVTTGPALSAAKMTIKRQDGALFSISSFSARILANTAGAGAAFEIMPLLAGEDGAPDPFMYDATGYAGRNFSYNTPQLTAFDTYKLTLYVDFALTSLTVIDDTPPPPTLDLVPLDASHALLSWPATASDYILESAASLPATSWNAVTNPVTTNGDVFSTQIDINTPQRFYRLRK